MRDEKPQRVELPATGVHVLPFMSSPTILAKRSVAPFLVVQLTPVEKGAQTEARCQIPMTVADAVQLGILILTHAI